jgi:molecular chaperone Hsp33
MADGLARALADDGTVRGLAAVTTELVDEARRRHGTLPTATAALGRALTAALLLGGTLKTGERVSLQFSGDGPLGTILVDATPDGAARGFVSRPATHLPARAGKLDVGGAVGRGLLCVMRTQVATAQFYRSIVPLVSGEIGIDVASYLLTSEQTPSVVAVGVFVEPDGRVGAAGGYLLQALPGAGPGTIEQLEANVGAEARPSDLVRAGLGPSGMLVRLLAGVTARVLAEQAVAFRCRCSRERVSAAMLTMGRAGLEEVLAGECRAEVVCEFCASRYVVDEAELRACLAALE